MIHWEYNSMNIPVDIIEINKKRQLKQINGIFELDSFQIHILIQKELGVYTQKFTNQILFVF